MYYRGKYKDKYNRKRWSKYQTWLYVNKKYYRRRRQRIFRRGEKRALHHVRRGNLDALFPISKRCVLWDLW